MLSDENNWKLRRERTSIKSIKVKWGQRWRREKNKSLLMKYLYLYWRKNWYKEQHCYVTSSLLSVSNNIWCQRGHAKIISSLIPPPPPPPKYLTVLFDYILIFSKFYLCFDILIILYSTCPYWYLSRGWSIIDSCTVSVFIAFQISPNLVPLRKQRQRSNFPECVSSLS